MYKIRHNGSVETRAVYNILGVDIEGCKDLIGLYLSESEGAKVWLSVLTDLNLAQRNIKKKWTMPLANWGVTAQRLAIWFPGRMVLDLA